MVALKVVRERSASNLPPLGWRQRYWGFTGCDGVRVGSLEMSGRRREGAQCHSSLDLLSQRSG
jgi:hypothetical protein